MLYCIYEVKDIMQCIQDVKYLIEMDSNYNPLYDRNKIHILMKIQQDY